MTNWEYAIIRNSIHAMIINRGLNPAEVIYGSIPEVLATIGDEGWELVSVTRVESVPGLHNEAYTQYTFKRPLPHNIGGNWLYKTEHQSPPEPKPAANPPSSIELTKS